jgi:hypothetical protein
MLYINKFVSALDSENIFLPKKFFEIIIDIKK